jgi:hypothetical protein
VLAGALIRTVETGTAANVTTPLMPQSAQDADRQPRDPLAVPMAAAIAIARRRLDYQLATSVRKATTLYLQAMENAAYFRAAA